MNIDENGRIEFILNKEGIDDIELMYPDIKSEIKTAIISHILYQQSIDCNSNNKKVLVDSIKDM